MGKVKISSLETGKTIYDSNNNFDFHRQTIKDAIKKYQERQMTNLPATKDFTRDELDLIKSTIAKGATDDELKLFLYRAKKMRLDPLKPGQIYFIKYGQSPGTIVIGIEGFRSKAAETGKHCGTQRGAIKDDKGRCVGAWCEVSRSDWSRPAREEVSLHEYNTGKGNWNKMPETMIKKVAEAAALRMAFPDDLGGIYVKEEMDQAEVRDASPTVRLPITGTIGDGKIEPLPGSVKDVTTMPPPPPPLDNPGEYVVSFGKKFKGLSIRDICVKEWFDPKTKENKPGDQTLDEFIRWCENEASSKGFPLSREALELKVNFEAYMEIETFMKESIPGFNQDEQLP